MLWIACRSGLDYDPETQTGIAFHMLSLLSNHGEVGLTCIANSANDAHTLYGSAIDALDKELNRAPTATWDESRSLPTTPARDGNSQVAVIFLIGDRQIRIRPKNGVFSDWIRAVAFAPDQPLLATAVNNRRSCAVRIHDRRSGQQLQSLEGPNMPLRDLAFGRNNLVVAGATDGSVSAWNAATGEIRWSGRQRGMVNAVVISHDGLHVAAGDSCGQLCVWDSETGQQMLEIEGQHGWVRCLGFTPDTSDIAAGFADGTVKLFEIETGGVRSEFVGPQRGPAY